MNIYTTESNTRTDMYHLKLLLKRVQRPCYVVTPTQGTLKHCSWQVCRKSVQWRTMIESRCSRKMTMTTMITIFKNISSSSCNTILVLRLRNDGRRVCKMNRIGRGRKHRWFVLCLTPAVAPRDWGRPWAEIWTSATANTISLTPAGHVTCDIT
jgi:hypothetical protein